jgi:hypothetical protein
MKKEFVRGNMSEEGYYYNIIEVAEAKSAEEANTLLKTGYELLKIAEKTILTLSTVEAGRFSLLGCSWVSCSLPF